MVGALEPLPQGAVNYPATGRNREPIADALTPHLFDGARVLEVASGTGQHVAYFAQRFPGVHFQPADREAEFRASIVSWVRHAGVSNVAAPLDIDTTAGPFPVAPDSVDVVLCSNMIHIAPWAACVGLLSGTAHVLADDGKLILYGPFKLNGEHTAPSNHAFDDSLKSRNSQWGVRDLADVTKLAQAHGLVRVQQTAMPANNLLVVFQK